MRMILIIRYQFNKFGAQMDSDDDDFGGFDLTRKDQKKMQLSVSAQKYVQQLTQQAKIQVECNGHLDPRNQASTLNLQLSHESIDFDNFLLKNKNKSQRTQVFDVLRDKLYSMEYENVNKISDKMASQVMVIRVIQKVENALNQFVIEDEFSKEKLVVKEGTLWVGMICAVQAEWADTNYKLIRVIDLSTPIPQIQPRLTSSVSAYRTMFVKGPFRPNFNIEDKGIKIITDNLHRLKYNNKMNVNCLVVMGPILSRNHITVKEFTLENRFEEQYQNVVKVLKAEVKKIYPEIQILIMPSLDDVVSCFPIPQPAYRPQQREDQVQFISNPSSLKLEGVRGQFKLDVVNYDILRYIDHYRGGKATKQLRQENYQTYIKQPFLLCNTKQPQQPFDQVNLSSLYNDGEFGDMIVISSSFSPPYINKVNGRLILNIGSLGVDYNETGNHYMVITSLYEGEGPASERIKVQTIMM